MYLDVLPIRTVPQNRVLWDLSKNVILLLISWGLFLKVTYAAWCLICATMSISIAKLNSEEVVLTKMTGRENKYKTKKFGIS